MLIFAKGIEGAWNGTVDREFFDESDCQTEDESLVRGRAIACISIRDKLVSSLWGARK